MKVKLRLHQTFSEKTVARAEFGLGPHEAVRTLKAHKYVELPSDMLISYFDFGDKTFAVREWSFSIQENLYVGEGSLDDQSFPNNFAKCEKIIDILNGSEWDSVKTTDREWDPPREGLFAVNGDWQIIAALALDGLRHRGIETKFDVTERLARDNPVVSIEKSIKLVKRHKD